MSNATLGLLIIAAILAQVAAIGLFNWQRQRIRFQVLERQGLGDAGATASGGRVSRGPQRCATTGHRRQPSPGLVRVSGVRGAAAGN